MNRPTPLQSISFPRSGFHLLMRHVMDYFGEPWRWCDNNQCCQDIPCQQAHTILQKNHDFTLNTPVVAGRPYVIQYRRPYPAICSWFELDFPERLTAGEVEAWHRFAVEKALFFANLLARWSAIAPPSALFLPYERLMGDPGGWIQGLIAAMSPEPVDADRLAEVSANLSRVRLAPPKDMVHRGPEGRRPGATRGTVTYWEAEGFKPRQDTGFPFHDPDHARFLEQLASWQAGCLVPEARRGRLALALRAAGIEPLDDLDIRQGPPPLVRALVAQVKGPQAARQQ
ncbi:hypothetical protein [Roseospirillum parvum]|uniref:Uncharacterized protein n=1 Tax=Roseospirillum parvum TaxID=83401 RepID=A0A1G7UZB8_9PROT|nr:hypothetical protein [Roseospirillum parvum]SDG52479.1 hypothetical protein SAMN05421742_101473 [Roseospirillum parvum]